MGKAACVLVVVWDLQCVVGRIQPISLCKPCVMSVRGPNNVRRVVQKICWELLAEKFYRFQTLRNNTQQHPLTCNRVCKTDATCNIQQCWELLANNVASVYTGLKGENET